MRAGEINSPKCIIRSGDAKAKVAILNSYRALSDLICNYRCGKPKVLVFYTSQKEATPSIHCSLIPLSQTQR